MDLRPQRLFPVMLSDTVDRKFVDSIDSDEWEILTPGGYKDINTIHKTVEYDVWNITLEDGKSIQCADDHIFIDSNGSEIFAKDSYGVDIMTEDGHSKVVMCENLGYSENMYDVSVDSDEHVFYANGILNHNTTSFVGFLLHYIIFNERKTVGILAHKKAGATEVLDRLKTAYENLPKFLQHGVAEWNKGNIVLENGSVVLTSASNGGGVRGKSISCVTGDTKVTICDGDIIYNLPIEMVEIFDDAGNDTHAFSVTNEATGDVYNRTIKTSYPNYVVGLMSDIGTYVNDYGIKDIESVVLNDRSP